MHLSKRRECPPASNNVRTANKRDRRVTNTYGIAIRYPPALSCCRAQLPGILTASPWCDPQDSAHLELLGPTRDNSDSSRVRAKLAIGVEFDGVELKRANAGKVVDSERVRLFSCLLMGNWQGSHSVPEVAEEASSVAEGNNTCMMENKQGSRSVPEVVEEGNTRYLMEPSPSIETFRAGVAACTRSTRLFPTAPPAEPIQVKEGVR